MVESDAEFHRLAEKLETTNTQLWKAEEQVALSRKAAETASLERDAAIAAKESLAAQLRMVKNKLRETEEELYRAEEDMAALRAELRAVHVSGEKASSDPSGASSEQLRLAEQERDAAKGDLQEAHRVLQLEQKQAAMERQRAAALQSEKDELEQALLAAREKLRERSQLLEKSSDAASPSNGAAQQASLDTVEQATTSSAAPIASEKVEETPTLEQEEDKAKKPESLEKEQEKGPAGGSRQEAHVRQLLAAVERLDKGREKLLAEVDAQSLQIERLYSENAGLSAGLQELAEISVSWEVQMREASRESMELRAELAVLRAEHAQQLRREVATPGNRGEGSPNAGQDGTGSQNDCDDDSLQRLKRENIQLQIELGNLKTQCESLAGRNEQLVADYTRCLQRLSKLSMLYKRILGGVVNKLKLIRQENSLLAVR